MLNLKKMKAAAVKTLNEFEGSVRINFYNLSSKDCYKIAKAIKEIGYTKSINEWKIKNEKE